jgi:hypothetical protein
MIPREVEERTAKMSYFPTKILLATDASKDAVKAAQIASDMASVSGSELHILHVGNTKDFHVAPGAEQSFSPRSPSLGEVREKAEKTLEEAVKQVEEAGGTVAGAHLRMGDPVTPACLSWGAGAWAPSSAGSWGASPRASSATHAARSLWRAARVAAPEPSVAY